MASKEMELPSFRILHPLSGVKSKTIYNVLNLITKTGSAVPLVAQGWQHFSKA